MEKTLEQFDRIMDRCREIFLKKTSDYGTAWRILRQRSLTDQIFIKASRIRSVEELGVQKVDDPVEQEYMGLVNYGIIALMQLSLPADAPQELPYEEAAEGFDREVAGIRELLLSKNHDYGEIWRQMRRSSMTDLILMKLLRIKQIEDNEGKTLISEGLDANYRDIVNYAIFALILLEEEHAGAEEKGA